MKILLTLCILVPIFSLGQIPFPSTPINPSLETARRENRILMVQLYSADCPQCNDVANKGLQSADVQEYIRTNRLLTVSYSISQKDGQDFIARYTLNPGTATIFISPSGNVIHRYYGSTTMGSAYVQSIRQAQSKLDDEKAIDAFEKAYAEGSRNPAILSQLLQLRENLGRETGQLLDEYAKSLPGDSLASLGQLQRLAGFAPVLNSYADSLMRAQGDRFQEAWYRMDLPTRVNINNRIIGKSKAIAIREHNRNRAIRVANFASGVQSDPYQKQRMYSLTMMDYHRAVGDTALYLDYAERFAERQLMRISPDSIRNLDSMAKQKMMQDGMQTAPGAPPGHDRTTTYTRTFTYTPRVQFYANDLNITAFNVYSFTRDPLWTEKAIRWSARSLEFQETAAQLDTYARLLYRKGLREEAIRYQERAMDLDIKKGMTGNAFREILEKMKSGEPL